jgi:hypothetical protein
VPGDDAAVAADAVLDVDALGAARRAVEHLLLAIEHVATGRPVSMAPSTASGSVSVSTLPPKPPPTVPPTKCRRFDSRFRILAVVPSEKNRPCAQEWTMKRSLCSGAAIEPFVLVGACSIGDIW